MKIIAEEICINLFENVLKATESRQHYTYEDST